MRSSSERASSRNDSSETETAERLMRAEAEPVDRLRRPARQRLEDLREHPAVDVAHQAVALGGRMNGVGGSTLPSSSTMRRSTSKKSGSGAVARQAADALAVEPEASLLQGLVDPHHPVHLVGPAHHLGVVPLVDLHPVAPALLGHVAGVVGRRQHLGQVLRRRVDRHQADRETDREALVLPGEAASRSPRRGSARRSAGRPRRRTDGRKTPNSSPPRRETTSPSRTCSTTSAAMRRSSSSPARWPQVSLTTLNWSRSMYRRQCRSSAPRSLRSAVCKMVVEGLPVEQPGERVVGRLVSELEGEQPLVGDVLKDDHEADGPPVASSGSAPPSARPRTAGRRSAPASCAAPPLPARAADERRPDVHRHLRGRWPRRGAGRPAPAAPPPPPRRASRSASRPPG